MDEYWASWAMCNQTLGESPLVIRLPDASSVTLEQFDELRTALQNQQFAVQGKLARVVLSRGAIDQRKDALLKQFNAFTGTLDAYYQGTRYLAVRPLAPGIGDGPDKFTGPLLDAASLWAKVNAAPAPAGVTLPVVLADGTDQEDFAAAVAVLETLYKAAREAAQELALARADREFLQERAYAIMKAFRQAVPVRLAAHPALVETMPRLTPLPGHTPEPVKAEASLVAPDRIKVTYGKSEDPTLYRYQLRGNVGAEFNHRDAVVIATHEPGAPREFVVAFNLTQPGTKVALKLYVILTTGNEAGSATMVVKRPATVQTGAA